MAKRKEVPMWSVGETSTIRNLATIGLNMKEARQRLPGRTPKQINARLAELELELDPDSIADIRRAGRKGVVFLREDVGGTIGLRWLCGHRSGAGFDVQKMEALLEAGLLRPAYEKMAESHFMWAGRD